MSQRISDQVNELKMIQKGSGLGPLKLTCPTCGYTLRIAEKWLQTIGAPACPLHGKMTIHWPLEPRAFAEARLEAAFNKEKGPGKRKSQPSTE